MPIVPLDKAVLRLSPGAREFLHAYGTNEPERSRTVFADAKGRIVAAAEQILLSEREALLAVERPFVPRLASHLARYLDLAGAGLEETPFFAYADLGGSRPPETGEFILPYGRGRILLSPHRIPGGASEEDFRRFRLENRLPVQGIDYNDEMVLNVFGEDAVSFTKGCYLGQEVLARVHYRAKPPRKLVVRKLMPGERSPALTSAVADPETGGTVGFVFEDN